LVVGDLPATDGLLAVELGFEFGLVLSGVTGAEDAASCDPSPYIVADDLEALVDEVFP
jgi:ribonucleotide monophosphatase NagD (HAD superfamily)